MAGSLNRVMLIGTADPRPRAPLHAERHRRLQPGARHQPLRQRPGHRRAPEFTDYHDVVVWNQGTRKLAETRAQYLQKGRLVYVEGRLQTRSWDDTQSGQKRYKTEVNANDVQFLDSSGRQDGAGAPGGEARPVPGPEGVPGGDVDPDDIPF